MLLTICCAVLNIVMRKETIVSRLCLFCFYDPKGMVDKTVEYLLKELYDNSERIIIIVNGKLENNAKKELEKYSEDIVVRENIGYDAGAYKFAIFNYLNIEEIKKYDELILCNDTFVGPFIPLVDIFSTMKEKKCDMWSINGVDWKFLPFIQSYFLVFRSSIIQNDVFFKYWHNIDEYTNNIEDVYAKFETGLFYYLTQFEHKKYSVYVPVNNCDIYKSTSVAIKKYGIPFIKKKALKDFKNNKDDIIDAIKYVNNNSCYPVENIIEYINRFCNTKITKKEVLEYKVNEKNVKEIPYIEVETTTEIVKKQINESDSFYIYGCGAWGRRIYWNLCRKKNGRFRGFLVSDIKKIDYDSLYGYDVMQFDKVDLNQNSKIILGVNKKNAIEIVEKYLLNIDNDRIISLFPNTLLKLMD